MSKRKRRSTDDDEPLDPRSIVSKPETGRYIYTFTFRLPFVLGFEDSFDHDIAVSGKYANEADAVVFGRSPFVRVRIFNADVADRKFAAANLPAAIEHFYGQGVPSGEVGGKPLYEQWVALETPAVFLSHEPRWDPAFAFHRSMSALNLFLEAFAIARAKDWIRPVSTRELRPTVAIGQLDLDGNWTYQGPMLIHPDAKPSPLASRPVAQHVEALNQALDLIVSEAPFIRARQWRARAERRKYEGDAADSIMSFQVAAETMLYELWGMLLLEEGTAPQEVDKRRDEQPFKTLLGTQLAPRLGGSWDLTLERKPVGCYWVDLYKLRNRMVHGGYQPHDGDAEKAERAYISIERFVDERLRAKRKRYPATLSAKLGEGAEVLLARLDAQGDAEAAGMLGQLLQNRGDSAGAEAAFRRADERGSAQGAASLARILEQKRSFAAAEELYARAADRGSLEGAFNLGVLLHKNGRLNEAEDAYRQAAAGGLGKATFNLGVLRVERGETQEAKAAFLQVIELNEPELTARARQALAEFED